MKEYVTPNKDDLPKLVVQFHPESAELGIGIVPRDDVPQKHMIDQIYGTVPSQTRIGKMFWEQKSALVGDTMFNAVDFQTSEAEAAFYNELGRAILDSVTGSTPDGNGWFTWLDRPASNRLVRLIRKGRNTAFGEDA